MTQIPPQNAYGRVLKLATMDTTSATPVTGLTRREIDTSLELHFTSGLRARKVGAEWQIGPILIDGKVGALTGISEQEVSRLGAEMGPALFGIDEIAAIDPLLPTRLWRPLLGLPGDNPLPSDSWGMIASSARAARDNVYASLASNLSASLQAAGLQLRNASDEYHKQLVAALSRGRKVGARFANLAMVDLHLAFHATLTEMASARDYLARVAARRVSAPSRIDALNRLREWAGKATSATALSDPLVIHLLEASDASSTDPWLSDITEYRNLFLHREHIGAGRMANRLVVQETQSRVGPVRTLVMAINVRPGVEATCDALTRFADLYVRLGRLAVLAASLAPYEAKPPEFVVADTGTSLNRPE